MGMVKRSRTAEYRLTSKGQKTFTAMEVGPKRLDKRRFHHSDPLRKLVQRSFDYMQELRMHELYLGVDKGNGYRRPDR